jgi:hypothetical protein
MWVYAPLFVIGLARYTFDEARTYLGTVNKLNGMMTWFVSE